MTRETDLQAHLSAHPASLRPTDPLALRLVARWGDSVLATCEVPLESDRALVLGGDPRTADLVLEHELLGAGVQVARLHGGETTLTVPPRARAAVRRKDGAVEEAAGEVDLAIGDRIALGFGAVTVIGEHVARSKTRLLRQAADFAFVRIAAISALVHLFLIVLAFLSPRDGVLFDGLRRIRPA